MAGNSTGSPKWDNVSVKGKMLCICLIAVALLGASCQRPVDLVSQPYLLDTGLLSRSISFENPTGAPGQGGK